MTYGRRHQQATLTRPRLRPSGLLAKTESLVSLNQVKPRLAAIKGFTPQQTHSSSIRVLNVLMWIATFRGVNAKSPNDRFVSKLVVATIYRTYHKAAKVEHVYVFRFIVSHESDASLTKGFRTIACTILQD